MIQTNHLPAILLFLGALAASGQPNPELASWLQNTTLKGRHYTNGNPVPIQDNVLANVQKVQYSDSWVYISTNGIPAYPTGPFLDGNPSVATAQNAIFRFSRNPVVNTGTPTATNAGNIGLFINGVALFDYRDGVAWNPSTGTLCGGPGNPPCPGGPGSVQAWNRDAIPAERAGFDCSKGHPAMGNYHHHQNPSAFNLDLNVVSTICNVYAADGLYAIDSNQHSPLIGFAADGFPIYGAYGYKNTDGTGGIIRMKSGYSLRNISTRTTSPAGQPVAAGPPVSTAFPLGYFREDYAYTTPPAGASDILDEHNGRFCVTPEYPSGTYCYFATVDRKWNSTYPYVVGPTFYGIKTASKVTSVTEPVQVYVPATSVQATLRESDITLFPNPASDLIGIQISGLRNRSLRVCLRDAKGRRVAETELMQGSTLAFFETETLYPGLYVAEISDGTVLIRKKLVFRP